MKVYIMTESEMKFASIIWEKEPVLSGELVKLCEKEFSWKKSTTYTVLKKLCEKNIFQNKDAVVTSRISKEEYLQGKSEKFLEENYGGSLPVFLAAFMKKKKLTKQQIEELKGMIEQYEEGQE